MNSLITILGPTATGKTKLAADLAFKIGGEIISADSRQVYKGMDIGTGKDLEEYVVEGKDIPYHLVDIVNPGYEFNVFEFQQGFLDSFEHIKNVNSRPILCGGSGLYLDSVLRSYDLKKVPENISLRRELGKLTHAELVSRLKGYGKMHNTTDIEDRVRTVRAIEIIEFEHTNAVVQNNLKNIKSINFGIQFERAILRERITERLKKRLSKGMLEEVQQLLDNGLKPEQLTFYGLEYKFITLHIIGDISFEDMFSRLNTAIHQFAKRQMTWYRRMEKKGVNIYWIEGNLPIDKKLELILERI